MSQITTLNFHKPHLQHTEESFFENTTAHLGNAQFPVRKNNGDLRDLKAGPSRAVFHLDLECVSHKTHIIKMNSFEHTPSVTFKPCCCIFYSYPQYHAHINGSEIRHEPAVEWPVFNVASTHIPRTNGQVGTLKAGIAQAQQVIGIVRKVTIHLEDIFITARQRPAKTVNIGCTQTELPLALFQMQTSRKFTLKRAHDLRSPIR